MPTRFTTSVLLLLVHAWSAAAQGSPPPAQTPPPDPPVQHTVVEVVAITPIQGLPLPALRVPANVQTVGSDAVRGLGALQISDALASAFTSVHVNEAQASAFQPDIQFRGFTASPLLGVSQGLALYQDGVRTNDPFGDTAAWDLLPATAVAGISLMPGSNPLFGLNALGGALSVRTKTGFSHPGYRTEADIGSFGRRRFDFEAGAHGARFAYFATGRLLDERGWRDFSPSRIRQFFGSLGWRGGASTVDMSLTASANRLHGNGAAPVQLLDMRRSAVFTHPDTTDADVALLTGRGRRALGAATWVDGVVYYRPSSVRTFNGDDTGYEPCEDAPRLLCAGENGPRIRDQFNQDIFTPGVPLDATNNSSATRTRAGGGSLQVTAVRKLGARENHLVAGVTFDGAGVHFRSDTELARLTEGRGTAGSGLFDADAVVRLRTRSRHVAMYVADFFSLTPRLTAMFSGRYSTSRVVLRDLHGSDLDGDHAFTRFNPAAGVTFEVLPGIGVYGSYTQSSRVPTPSELGCADPDAPCRLPNAFVADPPLRQVVARTWEGGVRRRRGAVQWSATAFVTRNRDDIIFVSSGALTNQGYFVNVPGTRRQGLETQVSAGGHGIEWSAGYTRLHATFDSPLVLSSPNHPLATGGEIAVRRGDQLPLVPDHMFKGSVTVRYRGVSFVTHGTYTSAQFLRGDEANLLPRIPGAAVMNMRAEIPLPAGIGLVTSVNNALNARYATFGLLGEPDEVLGDGFDDARFLSPAAPRAWWVGLRVRLR